MNRLKYYQFKIKKKDSKKKLSQFFLINKNTIKNIIFYCNINNNDKILEIGSGTGNLTKMIIKKTFNVECIEIDKDIIKIFKQNITLNNIKIFNIDFLNFKFITKYNKIISAVPYHILKPFIYKICYNHKFYDEVFLIIPKEIAKVINSKKNNFLSFFLSFFFKKIKILLYIKNNNFFPVPKIDSALVKFIKKQHINDEYDNNFKTKIQSLFHFKRKKIKFNFKKKLCKECYIKFLNSSILCDKRIENLNNNDILVLLKFINHCYNKNI